MRRTTLIFIFGFILCSCIQERKPNAELGSFIEIYVHGRYLPIKDNAYNLLVEGGNVPIQSWSPKLLIDTNYSKIFGTCHDTILLERKLIGSNILIKSDQCETVVYVTEENRHWYLDIGFPKWPELNTTDCEIYVAPSYLGEDSLAVYLNNNDHIQN